mmetsp:Transcript_21148/g.53868  ORF Transcript_21148/g.53868 Transcript_21148/m.53868 type:complete len:177 (+) Transcript_21148:70-600(+)
MRAFLAAIAALAASDVADPIVVSWSPLNAADTAAEPILDPATPLTGFGEAEPAAFEVPPGRITAGAAPLRGFGEGAPAAPEVEIPAGRIASEPAALAGFGEGDAGAEEGEAPGAGEGDPGAREVEIPAGRIASQALPLVGFGAGAGPREGDGASAMPRLRGFPAARADDSSQPVVA